jgi:hypothetical protein
MSFPVVYQPATTVAKACQPGAKALMAWCLENYPPGSNLGCYNPRNVRGGVALSLHAEGRAIDVGFPVSRPDGHHMGQLLAAHMAKHHADLGVQCVIFARRIWSNTHPTWRPYTGAADHFDHVHIELTREAAAGLTTDIIRQTLETPTVPTTENLYPAETAEALELLAQHAGYVGDRLWFGPDALAALHRLKNTMEDYRDGAAAEADLNDQLTAEVVTLRKATTTNADTITRLAGERDTARANREAAEAEVAQLRKQLQEGGRLPTLLAALDMASTDIGRAWDDLNEAIAKARA